MAVQHHIASVVSVSATADEDVVICGQASNTD